MNYENLSNTATPGALKKCPGCGAECDSKQNYCTACGTSLNVDHEKSDAFQNWDQNQQYTTQNPNEARLVVNENDLAYFICDNQVYYRNKFQKMRVTNSKISWNWAAFLFGNCWLVYRKMYGICAIVYSTNFVLSRLLPYPINLIFSLALWVCYGLFGNYVYMRHAENEIIYGKTMDDNSKKYYYIKKGGTSGRSIVVYLLLEFLVGFLFAFMKNMVKALI